MLKDGAEMQTVRIWLLLALVSLSAGCFPTIYSERPLGEPAALDSKQWNGRWLNNSGEWTTFLVIDTDTLAMGEGDICSPSPTSLKQTKLRRSTGWYILQEKLDEAASTSRRYSTSGVMKLQGQVLYAFWINEHRVKALVEQGELPGRIEGGRVVLGTLTEDHYKLLFNVRTFKASVKYPMTAKNDFPIFPVPAMTYVKLPDDLDPCKKDESSR